GPRRRHGGWSHDREPPRRRGPPGARHQRCDRRPRVVRPPAPGDGASAGSGAAGWVGSRPMGEIIGFASNGGTAQGYLAAPATGTGVPLVVIQEWWGLVPHITDVCERFAAEGFLALAPDLYRGETTTEPDEA